MVECVNVQSYVLEDADKENSSLRETHLRK